MMESHAAGFEAVQLPVLGPRRGCSLGRKESVAGGNWCTTEGTSCNVPQLGAAAPAAASFKAVVRSWVGYQYAFLKVEVLPCKKGRGERGRYVHI